MATLVDYRKDFKIGEELFKKIEKKIIFAISVHSTECWLLPLYYSDNRKGKIVNCLNTLNEALKKGNFTIDSKNKMPQYYEIVSKKLLKHKTLMKIYKHNPSLKTFIEEINKKKIVIEEEEDF